MGHVYDKSQENFLSADRNNIIQDKNIADKMETVRNWKTFPKILGIKNVLQIMNNPSCINS